MYNMYIIACTVSLHTVYLYYQGFIVFISIQSQSNTMNGLKGVYMYFYRYVDPDDNLIREDSRFCRV